LLLELRLHFRLYLRIIFLRSFLDQVSLFIVDLFLLCLVLRVLGKQLLKLL
jgi:hypothetical protein